MKIGAVLSTVLLCMSIEWLSLCVAAIWGSVVFWWVVKAAAEGGAY